MTKKVFIISLVVIVFLTGIAAAILYIPRSIKKVLPKINDILQITQIYDYNGESYETELDESNYQLFLDQAARIRYVRWYNFLRRKCMLYSPVEFRIDCADNTVIRFGSTRYTISKPDGTGDGAYFYTLTKDPFPEIYGLFAQDISP